jgi:hypothetical protein
MSKKNISKTAIEGGRTFRSKDLRRESSQTERSNVNAMIAGQHGYAESFDDLNFPKRKKVYKDFFDRLSPVERWLDSRVGKSWNKTYSMLREKFDSRTTAGRHIVNDHILRDIWPFPNYSDSLARYRRYYVDDRGILRKAPSLRKEREEAYNKLKEERTRAEEWLEHRMIGKIGNVLYWYNPTVRSYSHKFDWYEGRYNVPAYGTSNFIYPLEMRFIRGERLKGRDIEFFTKLAPNHKDVLLKHSKTLGACNCIHAVHHHYAGECRIEGCKCAVKWVW